jgi:hypothetical protein
VAIPLGVRAVTLYLLPQSQTIYQGDTFLVEVKLDTEGEEINAVEGYLNFPEDKLEIIDIGVGGSILNLWPKSPSYSNQTGEISFLGGIPKGFKGEGKLVSATFRVLPRVDPHQSFSITFKENSKVLLNDGKGTPAKLNFLEGNYEIVEKPENLPKISSRTNPDQNKWYSQNTLHLHWDLVEGAEYSFLLSKDPLAEPDEIPDKPEPKEGLIWIGDMEYPNLEDGIYYFHLRERRETDAKLNAEQRGKWGPKITFRAMIDATPPEDFKPEISKDPAIFEGKYFLSFATADKTSGVDHYEILEEPQKNLLGRIFTQNQHKTEHETTQNWKVGESPYLLEDQSLKTKILVKAVDKAGNEKISEIIPPEKPFPYWIIPIIIICLVIIGWIIKKYFLKRQQ